MCSEMQFFHEENNATLHHVAKRVSAILLEFSIVKA